MGKSTFEGGFKDALEGDHDPPGHVINETLSSDTHDYYEGLREDYEAGHEAGTTVKENED